MDRMERWQDLPPLHKSHWLEMNDFHVHLVVDGHAAISAIDQLQFDICLLDIMLPKMDGFTVAAKLKEKGPDLPFIFLTAKA